MPDGSAKKGDKGADRDDLGRFVPGHKLSGPGRPVGLSITKDMREWMDKPASSLGAVKVAAEENGLDPETHTVRQVFAAMAITQGLIRDGALREIWNREEGKVPEKLELERASPLSRLSDEELDRIIAGAGEAPEARGGNGEDDCAGSHEG